MARKDAFIGTIPDLLTVISRGVHAANEDMEALDLRTLVYGKGKDLIPRVMAFSGGKIRIRCMASIDKKGTQVKLFGLGDSKERKRNDQFELDVELDLVVMKPTNAQVDLVASLTTDDVDKMIADRKLSDAGALADDRFTFHDPDGDEGEDG